MANLVCQLGGLRLATAEILYYLPDYPKLLQSFIWQDYDNTPDFPHLHSFLDFWESHLDGRLHSCQVVTAHHITAGDYEQAQIWLTLQRDALK
jgi:uncharacterized protein Usg